MLVEQTPAYTAPEVKAIFKTATELWMNNTCIDFREDETEEAEDLLLVFKEHGCWAELGRQGGWQLLSLDDDCKQVGIIAHEIGHALGFWHTQSRYDRNQFITVFRKNIKLLRYLKEVIIRADKEITFGISMSKEKTARFSLKCVVHSVSQLRTNWYGNNIFGRFSFVMQK
ncbi:astacin [Teladorsagia circumcincta]|uniref:Metalloendopeptidase n=1 Tax=Teladorsagia circumcincta TaxID=45464 RepID=A0A2G9TZK0_TELCI|nr:astacin [Teladorsagia circumcincta]